MAGYGNRTAADYVAEDLEDQHRSTRLGLHESSAPYSNPHHTHGSGTTGGAGFGNKRSSVTKTDSNDSEESEEFRFGVHKDTAPYSGATPHGSGSTGGAGFGNKTGSFNDGGGVSTLGKVMEKAGHVLHNPKLAEKGKVMKEEKGVDQLGGQ